MGRREGKRLPHPSFSAEAFGSSTSGREETGSRQASRTGVSSPWKTVTALAFVIGLILLVAKLLKKHGPTSVAGLPDEAIELLGKRAIDRQQAIHLVRCGSRILVLGVSPGEVRTLAEITDPIEVDFLSGICRHKGQQTTVLQTFRTLFEKYSPGAGRAAGSAPSVKSGEPPAAHVGPRPPFGSAPSRGPDDVSFEAVAVANRSESVSHPLTS
ncbi:MAG: FliO/MopB family protein [Planctomycetes bacterium]|nr:FliO/MopB family protein [Planctomycetota bacterium]